MTLIVERRNPRICVLTIDRPERRNALNLALRARIADEIVIAGNDPDVRVVVITGQTNFAAGADVGEMADATPVELMGRRVHRYAQAVADCPKPVISAIEGYALGGGLELALCTDVIVAADDARMGFPEIKLGIFPGGGGTQRLLRRVSLSTAYLMLYTGQLITGREAFDRGLVSAIAPPGQALDAAMQIAATISDLPPLALAQLKEVVGAAQDVPLSQGLKLERNAFQVLFASEDQKTGMRAFLEKTKPVFTGR